ncbi:hypothetical protein ACGF3C_09520 [Micromonospora sp. NPDC047762]|uniref:hypothetical protein n=1 Tax=unclassified Micromonospora TaxID=2617518 RepID=UPI0033E5C938
MEILLNQEFDVTVKAIRPWGIEVEFPGGIRGVIDNTNLAYRLACLQRPDDLDLLREAAADLLSFGPDWDDHAERLKDQANRLMK